MAAVTEVSSFKCYTGHQKIFKHYSKELKCDMIFSVFIPPQASVQKCPVLYWLSGLTCTEKNFIEKSGFQRHAVTHGIIVVGPDTSPRGCNIEGEDESYDFGSGAGFYVNATEEKWKTNYRMYSYVTKELPILIEKEFPTNGKSSIIGHSMGGHGALICALKNPGKYVSVSAFAPICNPSQGPWGKKAFTGYLGPDQTAWAAYDATSLVKTYDGPPVKLLIDQGTEDIYLKDELLPNNLVASSKNTKVSVELRMKEGYDHSYYFMSTFMGDHFDYHAACLNED